MFNGRLKITVIKAENLQQTNFMTRLQFTSDPSAAAGALEPYVAVDVDEVAVERTTTKAKTREPVWNETFTTDLFRNAENVGFTVFHDATMPPDDFIANCKIALSDLITHEERPVHNIEVRFHNNLEVFVAVGRRMKIMPKLVLWLNHAKLKMKHYHEIFHIL